MTYYRALFDLLNIPYLGNTPDVMALAINKAKAKAVVAAAGVSVPPGELLRPGNHPSIAPPAVIKPVDADNSLGVVLVRNHADYDTALKTAFAYADEVLVETFIDWVEKLGAVSSFRMGSLSVYPWRNIRWTAIASPFGTMTIR